MTDKKTKPATRKPSEKQPVAGGPLTGRPTGWFSKQISRRSVGKGLAWTAILGMAGVTVYKLTSGDDNEVSYDSLDLQKKEGWNVGSTAKTLIYPAGLTSVDSLKRSWDGLDPNYLISIYQPSNPLWQPFFVPTLLQSISQTSLNSQIRLVNTPAMNDAYQRAEGLGELVSQSPNANETLIIVDLPGPESVAVGAALSGVAQIVPTFDNWPHPLGVVRSHETIGALVYYAHEVEDKKSKLPQNAPAVMLLDNTRLSPYTDQDLQFDNRYLAKLPPADQIKQRGIQQIIYVVRDESVKEELDDLNDDFVNLQKNGINVRLLKLSDFKPDDESLTATGNPIGGGAGAGSTPGTVVHHHHYGGSPLWAWLFFSHYGYGAPRQVVVMRDGGSRTIPRPTSPAPFEPPNYRPTSRPTIFSASRVGTSPGSGGVGKTKPTGFGRTSVRVSNDGRVTGTRPGRSGSFGRSGGGWFGG